MRARFVLSEIMVGLRRNLTMTFAVIVTVAVSLGLIGLALLVQDTVTKMNHYYYGKLEVSIFLSKNVTQAERESIDQILTADPRVKKVVYESQLQAYHRFEEQFKDEPQLAASATPDSLPESYRVQLKDPRQFAVIASEFATVPGVDQVVDQGQLLHKIFQVLDGIRTGAVAVALAQVVAAVLLIGNTVRLAAFGRRRETGIMRLVGASNIYIQLPFLLEGAVAGLIGGLFACGVLVMVKTFLFDRWLQPVLHSGVIPNVGWDRVLLSMPLLLLIGVLVSAVAAFVSLLRYLRV